MAFQIDLKYILEAEKEYGLVFPHKFKCKMVRENGGELITSDDHWQLFPFFDKSDKKRISRTCNHIGIETKMAKTWDNFPSNGVAIATNESGDYLVLLPSNTDCKVLMEEVYIWYHETGEVNKIANSIDEF
jgi:hypothetical protein